MRFSDSVTADLRYSFTRQFLEGARFFVREAEAIEAQGSSAPESDHTRHRAFVVGAIMQAISALESEAYEVMNHGPGHHLGSNGIDEAMRSFLEPLADVIDSLSVLDRFEKILYLTRSQPLDRGSLVCQDIALAIRLRNEITHYKSIWGSKLDRQKLIQELRRKGFQRPPFISEGHLFFPHQVLGASCARWCVASATAFLAEFCTKLGFANRMDSLRERPIGPTIR